jgi:hypothetical protein
MIPKSRISHEEEYEKTFSAFQECLAYRSSGTLDSAVHNSVAKMISSKIVPERTASSTWETSSSNQIKVKLTLSRRI